MDLTDTFRQKPWPHGREDPASSAWPVCPRLPDCHRQVARRAVGVSDRSSWPRRGPHWPGTAGTHRQIPLGAEGIRPRLTPGAPIRGARGQSPQEHRPSRSLSPPGRGRPVGEPGAGRTLRQTPEDPLHLPTWNTLVLAGQSALSPWASLTKRPTPHTPLPTSPGANKCVHRCLWELPAPHSESPVSGPFPPQPGFS